MAWLARLDAKSARWPRPVRWPYVALKWSLVALGVYLVIGRAFVESGEHRLGIGLGVVTVLVLALIKGVLLVFYRDDA